MLSAFHPLMLPGFSLALMLNHKRVVCFPVNHQEMIPSLLSKRSAILDLLLNDPDTLEHLRIPESNARLHVVWFAWYCAIEIVNLKEACRLARI